MSTSKDIGDAPMSGDDARRRAEGQPDVGVLIVDDQPFFRSAAREVVGALPGFHAIAEASSGPEAVAAVGELHPQLVLLDVRMPGMDGIETARQITARHPETVVVLISIEDIIGVPSDARTCGAAAVIRKQDFRPSVLRELWIVHGPHPA
jgi:two-component system invasion response regulator UvrY